MCSTAHLYHSTYTKTEFATVFIKIEAEKTTLAEASLYLLHHNNPVIQIHRGLNGVSKEGNKKIVVLSRFNEKYVQIQFTSFHTTAPPKHIKHFF